jgi:palmitoyltransferase
LVGATAVTVLEIGLTSLLLWWCMWQWVVYIAIALLAMSLVLIGIVSGSDPGIITNKNVGQYRSTHGVSDSFGHIYKARQCSTCRLKRPALASHCSVCNTCVASLDHHCTLLNKCIGLRN